MRHPDVAVPVPGPDGLGRSFGVLTSFPPTACGIATFSAALAAGLVAQGASVDVVRTDAAPDVEDPAVRASIGACASEGRQQAIDVLDGADVAIVQHEFGLYAGTDGDAVIAVLADLTVPTIVVAHTVVQRPTPHQRSVLERVCAQADSVVVMTVTARNRLLSGYDVEPSKVVVIPHGAATPPADTAVCTLGQAGGARPRLLTWGLIGPGKGIEWAIDAVATLGDLAPTPHYLVAGATHPKVAERSGEAYRDMLTARAHQSGATDSISFDDSYRDLSALTDLIRSADLVVLPYDSQDQVTSGVLVDAVAAGRPVVSTAFPHAVELLGSGAGLIVPQSDPTALAAAIRSVLTDPELAASMAAEACRLAPDLSWRSVAGQYDSLAGRLAADLDPCRPAGRAGVTVVEPSFGHLLAMSTTHRHLRARRPCGGAAQPRLLHRRHGPRADRGVSRAAPRPRADGTGPAGPGLPGSGPGSHRTGAEPPWRRRTLAGSAGRRGQLGPEPLGLRHGRRPRAGGLDAPTGPLVVPPRSPAAFAVAPGDGLRRAGGGGHAGAGPP